jgi:anti-anti-sigma factor
MPSTIVSSADGRRITAVDPDDPPGRLVARLTARTSAGMASIELTGELTRATSGALIELARAQLGAAGTSLRIHLGRVSYLDARGLAALVVTARMAAGSGAAVAFLQPSPTGRRLLEIGGLADLCEPKSRRPA